MAGPTDPLRRFEETTRCERCGSSVRVLGLSAHQAGAACETRATLRHMREMDWERIPGDVRTDWALRLFKSCGIPWGVGAVRAYRDRTEDGVWAPGWACVMLAVLHPTDVFRLGDRMRAVAADPELQQAITSAWMLAIDNDGDPVVSVFQLLRTAAPDLYPPRRR